VTNNRQPVIKQALGKDWDGLADIVKQHYEITPGEPSSMVLKGVMTEVYHSAMARLFLLLARMFGALVPYKGQYLPTEVRNWTSDMNNKAMYWHRTLDFPNKSPVIFASRMEHIKDNEIIEYVRYGLGIRMSMSVDDGALVFNSKGYVWNIAGIRIPIPAWLIMGEGKIIEKAIAADKFYINFEMIHPLFGKTFAYSGEFCITDGGNNSTLIE